MNILASTLGDLLSLNPEKKQIAMLEEPRLGQTFPNTCEGSSMTGFVAIVRAARLTERERASPTRCAARSNKCSVCFCPIFR